MIKKVLFITAALLASYISNAQISIGRIGTGNINIAGTQWNDAFGIDFNYDGTLEFRLSDFQGIDGNQVNAYISYNWTEGGDNVMADPDIWDYAAVISQGDVIDGNGNFAGYGDATFENLADAPDIIYVGFRIKYTDGVHYGWAKAAVDRSNPSEGTVLNWTECAFNTTPGAAIAAGQIGSNAISDVETSAINAYSLGQNKLHFEDLRSDVMLYDLNGRLLNTVHATGSTTITLPQAGIYLLRSEGITRKVFVY